MAQRILSASALALGGAALMLGGCSSMASDATLTGAIVATASPPPEGTEAAASGAAKVGLADATQSDLARLIKLNAPLNDDGTMGSGCGPQEDAALPDGTWYVFVSHVTLEGADVDLACMFGEGSEPWKLHRETAGDADEWTNHVVTNDVVNRIHVDTSADVVAYLAASDWEPVDAEQALAQSPPLGDRESAGVWIVVDNGVIAEVIEPAMTSEG